MVNIFSNGNIRARKNWLRIKKSDVKAENQTRKQDDKADSLVVDETKYATSSNILTHHAHSPMPLDGYVAIIFIGIFALLAIYGAYIAMLHPEWVANGLKTINPDLKKQSVAQLFPEQLRYGAVALAGFLTASACFAIIGLWKRWFKAWVFAIYLMAGSMIIPIFIPLAIMALGSLLKEKVIRLYVRQII